MRAIGKTEFGKPIDKYQLSTLFQNVIRLIGTVDNKANIIDMGCGTGVLSEVIYENFSDLKLLLVDPNLENIQKCRKIFSNSNNIECFNIDHRRTLSLANKSTILFTYEVIQHLDLDEVANFTRALFAKGVKKIIYGGVPDLHCRHVFYENRSVKPSLKNGCDDIIGYWYVRDFFTNISARGYKLSFSSQGKLYTATYRYDVTYMRDN